MKPDLLLIAMKFPDISGIEIIKKIRSMNEGEFYKTPILMLLDKVSQNLLREACRAGIEGALRKPIVPSKVIRFSRAVIQKPRRFICMRHYFGPERRMRSDPHFEGGERRNGFKKDDFDPDQFTRNRPPVPGQSSLGSEPVLSGAKPNADAPNWEASTTKPKADAGVIDYSSDEFKSSSDKSSNEGFDITSETLPDQSNEIDYGSSSDQKDKTYKEQDFTSQDKPEEVSQNLDAIKEDTKDENVEVVETGPDDDDFEEIIDLDDCLELHKTWVNSGGKSGKQAKRPHSDFRGQDLEDADFTRAILPQSNFEDVKCPNAVFRKSDLSGSTFKNALLSSADLRVARLTKADFRNARLEKANLLGADLSGANFEGASLRGVNFSGANLNLTNLRGVNLASSQGLLSDQVKRAITDSSTRLPLSIRTTS